MKATNVPQMALLNAPTSMVLATLLEAPLQTGAYNQIKDAVDAGDTAQVAPQAVRPVDLKGRIGRLGAALGFGM